MTDTYSQQLAINYGLLALILCLIILLSRKQDKLMASIADLTASIQADDASVQALTTAINSYHQSVQQYIAQNPAVDTTALTSASDQLKSDLSAAAAAVPGSATA